MEEIDLKELFGLFWQKKVYIILIVLIFMLLGVIYTLKLVVPKYEASTTLLLATDSSAKTAEMMPQETITTTDVTLNSNLVSTYSELVKSNKITRTVISNLGLDASEEEVRNSVSVTAVDDTEIIQISVRDEDAVKAAKIANEIAKVFIENIKEYYGIENVHVVDEAEVEEVPYNIDHVKDVALAICVGIMVSAVYVFLSYMLDTTIKSVEDIENITGVTALVSIPLYEEAMANETKKKKEARR